MKIPLTNLQGNPTPLPPAGINYQNTGGKLCYGSFSSGLVLPFYDLVSNPFEGKLSFVDGLDWHIFILDLLPDYRTDYFFLL